MRTISTEPLTAAAFAPFGQVIERVPSLGRVYTSEALANGRPDAKASLSMTHAAPLATPKLVATRMERHEFSSQSFVPVDVSRYLVIVAPHGTDGRPDASQLKAFVASGTQGVTYGMNVWHHPMTVLDRSGQFAIFMWLDGGRGDEEFVDLQEPVTIEFPATA